MNPLKVDRHNTVKLTDLPNIGKAGAADLLLLGITRPADLIGLNPYEMFEMLCVKTGRKHDPCVIDVFISIVHFMEGGEPQPWWAYTNERKEAINAFSPGWPDVTN
ncbi:helix-hairpin-helix domain-containing protein [Alteromonas lipolytica]|uniref:Mitomycin resistance protein n=1 Tax=Alteromonas lipolytica TaxID=1856405 RepID=A0A1E8FIF9_9ALTE|nr:helix-hairpin-helix domain-containing protein [Alteromonas lipolytica]OFI35730.1 mitomycin resistance protein [Alteromonas lipolytica]GGF80294.1 mitomycin resistance protein [Alteromonas lipolytica]